MPEERELGFQQCGSLHSGQYVQLEAVMNPNRVFASSQSNCSSLIKEEVKGLSNSLDGLHQLQLSKSKIKLVEIEIKHSLIFF